MKGKLTYYEGMQVILQADLITHFLQYTNKKIPMLITEEVLLHYKKLRIMCICIQLHSVLLNNPLLTGRLLSFVISNDQRRNTVTDH